MHVTSSTTNNDLVILIAHFVLCENVTLLRGHVHAKHDFICENIINLSNVCVVISISECTALIACFQIK